MNSATFKTLREACGLSVSELAGLMPSTKRPGECLRERTVQYWEKGVNPIPDDVAKFIQDLDNKLTSLADTSIKAKITKLHRYRSLDSMWFNWPSLKNLPVSCHAAFINRVRLRVDHEVTIEWYED